jgi:hypothetical protein
MAIPVPNARTIAAQREALAVLADSPDGCTRAEMSRRGFGPAVLNHLLLNRLAIAHVATEVRGGTAIQTRLTITPAGLREISDGDGDRTLFRAAPDMIGARCVSDHPSGKTTRPPPGSPPRAMMAVSISTSL